MIREATTEHLQTAAEDHLYAALEQLSALPNAEIEHNPHLACYRVPGIPNPMFNGVIRVQLTAQNADDTIKEVIAWYRERQVPNWFWWTGTTPQPSDLHARLEQHGLLPWDVNSPAMAVDLRQMDETTNTPPDYRESIVETESDLRLWVDTFITAFGVPPFAGESWYTATQFFGIQSAPWRLYLGWLNRDPVAISMLFPAAGIAGILAVGTLEAARGKGIGRSITLRPLVDARIQGYKVGALFSSDMGFSVYKKIGFVQYGVISRYLYRQA